MPAHAQHKEETLRYTITIDGSPLSDSVNVLSVVVREAASRPARLELLALPQGAGLFKDGGQIKVSVFDGPIFDGVVENIDDFRRNGEPMVRVLAEDRLGKLRHTRTSKVYTQVSPEQILSDLLSLESLSCTAPASGIEFDQYLVFDQSILDVCEQLAADAGWLFRCEGKQVTFLPLDATPAPVLTCETGVSLLHFSGGTREVPRAVKFESWQLDLGQSVHAEKTVTGGKGKDVLRQSANPDQAILQFLAKGAASELAARGFAGDGSIPGSTEVSPGVRLDLKSGSDPEFKSVFTSGTYLVTACEHRIEDGDYVTNFSVGLDAPLPRPPRASPPLLLATVSKVDQDPDAMDRIQVKIAALDGAEAMWAHPVVPFAGFHFPHAIGDQVLLSFLPGDFSVPVLLGGLPTRNTREALRLPKPTEKRGAGQLIYGKAVLSLGAGETGPASASLAGPTCKVEVVDGSKEESKVLLHGGGDASVEVQGGAVHLKATGSTVDLDAAGLIARVTKLEAIAQTLLRLESSAALAVASAAQMDLRAAVVSINGDALKVI